MKSFWFGEQKRASLLEKVMVSSCVERRHSAKVTGKQPKLVLLLNLRQTRPPAAASLLEP